jgi:DNA-binding transcriptional MerR regulator
VSCQSIRRTRYDQLDSGSNYRMPRRRNLPDRSKPGHVALTAESLAVSSPDLGMPTLTVTVGQITEQLATIAPNKVTTRERLRHWTREGLLSPVADHHSGTGTHRQYSPSSAYDAAVLHAIACAGLNVVSRPYLQTALSKASEARQKWEQAEIKGPLFLEIAHNVAQGTTEILIHEGQPTYDTSAELTIVINLARIFASVRPSRTGGAGEELCARPPCANRPSSG